MKRFARIATSGIALLILAACGGSGGGSNDSSDSEFTSTAGSRAIAGPELSVDPQTLDNALECAPFEHPDKPVVLLVHGTFTNANEQYTLFYTPRLAQEDFDVCAVTYPDRGLGDQQISAEYVVNALRRVNQRTDRKIAMIGHSQGASMPRWALKFWPTARAVVEDFVLIAGPTHGTNVTATSQVLERVLDLPLLSDLPVGVLPEGFFQFNPGAQFNKVVNTGDETPGDIDYTNLYTRYDELVRPVRPEPTAALDLGEDNPHVSNILLQDVCPANLSEHVTIGTTDPVAYALALDAISHPGPADAERAGGMDLCKLLPVQLSDLVRPDIVKDLLTVLRNDVQNGVPRPHLAKGEPPLRDYAQAVLDQKK